MLDDVRLVPASTLQSFPTDGRRFLCDILFPGAPAPAAPATASALAGAATDAAIASVAKGAPTGDASRQWPDGDIG